MLNKYTAQLKNEEITNANKKKEISRKMKQKRNILAQNMEYRRKEWLDQIVENTEFQKFYNEGAIKLTHPANIEFRNRVKELERNKKAILAYKYQPDRAKSMATLHEYRSGHLQKENYDDKAPNNQTGWLRPRVRDNEINSKMRYNTNNDNERISQYLKSTSKINAEPLDTDMLYNTPYREFNKGKWVSKKIFNVYKGHKQKKWSETKLQPDSPEPYSEACRDIERNRDTSRELTKSSFSASFPKDTWDERINRSKSIRSYMGIFGALKSVSPKISLNPSHMKSAKSIQDLQNFGYDKSFLMTKEDEDAIKGREAENAADMFKMMHSPKTAPTMEANLKYTHNKTASNVKENVDELHLHEKINKLKSYYKSAQGQLADELSRKAHRSRMDKMASPNLSR